LLKKIEGRLTNKIALLLCTVGVFVANSAQSLTCSPLSYQLATDTLRAKWGAPFNMLLLGEVTNIGRAFCGPLSDFNDMRSSVTLDGIDLNTGWKYSGLEVIAYHLNDKECDDKLAASAELDFADSPQIFFLEVDSENSVFQYTLQPTTCGSSIWPSDLEPVIKSCFSSVKCSVHWFDTQELPQGYFEVFYK